MRERTVIVATFPGCEVLDVAAPLQAFHDANACGARYRVVVAGTVQNVAMSQPVTFGDVQPLPPARDGDLIVIPGGSDTRRGTSPRTLVAWLRANRRTGAEFCAICTGAFLLGEAGMLDGVKCTTHWKHLDELQRRYPLANVTKDRLFITDDRITTSAGVASGIDVALWFVERHFGPLVAARTAREMVIHVRRDGSHAQDSVYLSHRAHLNSAVHRVQDFIIANPSEKVGIAELARIAGMSSRSITRTFRASTGITIAQYRQQIRLENARTLLRQPSATIERVAEQVGFKDSRHLRRLWNKHFGASPSSEMRPSP